MAKSKATSDEKLSTFDRSGYGLYFCLTVENTEISGKYGKFPSPKTSQTPSEKVL